MRTWLLTLGSGIFLTACGAEPQTQLIATTVPSELREPCPISDRRAVTLRDLSILATEHLHAAQCANGRIKTIDEILTDAERKAAATRAAL